MRIVFMGTPTFAVCTLKRLVESEHEVIAVVSQPDRQAGRGKKVHLPPVKEFALECGISVYQPEKIKTPEFRQLLAELQPELIVVIAYGKILPEAVLQAPRHGCWNIHASLLPKYRGAAPIQWALINGEKHSGVTVMQMDKGLDTGDILCQREVEILDDDDAVSLGNMLSVMGADLLVETVNRLEADGQLTAEPQDNALATHARILTKEDGRIDWQLDPEAIICRINGLKPWPGAFTIAQDKVYKLHGAIAFYPGEMDSLLEDKQTPGEIISLLDGRGPLLRTKDSCLCLTSLQPPNRRAMSGQDAINGGYVKCGMKFE